MMRQRNFFIGLGVLFWLTTISSPALSLDKAPEHGKIRTADATPVETGKFELEFAYRYARAEKTWDGDGRLSDRRPFEEQALGLTLVSGWLKDLDVRISLDYLWLKDEEHPGPQRGNGLGDMGLRLRYRFFHREEINLELAWISGLTVPSGSRSDGSRLGTGQECWSWENALVLTKDWGKWTVNGELGYSLPFGDGRGTARGSLFAHAALGYQVLPWLQPEVEIHYSKDFVSEGEAGQGLAVTTGLVLPVHERLRIQGGGQWDLWGRNTDQGLRLVFAVKTVF